MDFSELTRDGQAIDDAIYDDEKVGLWIARKPVSIVFPKKYTDGKLGSIDTKFNVVASFAIVCEDKYDVISIPSIMPLVPSEATVFKIEGEDYYRLSWEDGDLICPNTNLVQRNALAFQIYDNFIAKGKLPPYMDSQDHLDILDNILPFCGVDLEADPAVLEVFNPAMTRSLADKSIPAREFYTKQSDFTDMPVDRIPLRSVAYGADNTTARVLGSYLNQGVLGALVNPSQKIESIEQILTS